MPPDTLKSDSKDLAPKWTNHPQTTKKSAGEQTPKNTHFYPQSGESALNE